MKTKNIWTLNREACLSWSSSVHCKIQCKHGRLPPALCERTGNKEATPRGLERDRHRTRLQDVPLTTLHWLDTDRKVCRAREGRHGTVRTLGTPTTFQIIRQWRRACKVQRSEASLSPTSAHPVSFFKKPFSPSNLRTNAECEPCVGQTEAGKQKAAPPQGVLLPASAPLSSHFALRNARLPPAEALPADACTPACRGATWEGQEAPGLCASSSSRESASQGAGPGSGARLRQNLWVRLCPTS